MMRSVRADKIVLRENSRDIFLHSIIEANNGPAFILDRKFCYIDFNSIHASTMKSIFGVNIARGMNILKCMTVAEDREKARHNLE